MYRCTLKRSACRDLSHKKREREGDIIQNRNIAYVTGHETRPVRRRSRAAFQGRSYSGGGAGLSPPPGPTFPHPRLLGAGWVLSYWWERLRLLFRGRNKLILIDWFSFLSFCCCYLIFCQPRLPLETNVNTELVHATVTCHSKLEQIEE